MKNLLKEIIDILEQNNKSESDVLWCGDETRYFTWEHFKSISNKEYDNCFCGAEVLEIKIVGSDFWLERYEYDGSEWWEYKVLPKKPEKEFNVISVFVNKLNSWLDDLGKDYYCYSDTTLEKIEELSAPIKVGN